MRDGNVCDSVCICMQMYVSVYVTACVCLYADVCVFTCHSICATVCLPVFACVSDNLWLFCVFMCVVYGKFVFL